MLKDRSDLAYVITNMNYGTLMSLCGEFAQMCEEGNGVREHPKTASDFAEMLFDWAEARIQDNEDQRKQRLAKAA